MSHKTDLQRLVGLMSSIENHLYLLKLMQKSNCPYVTDIQDEAPADFNKLVMEWSSLADSLLITASGNPNYAAFVTLEKKGYQVNPGEQDSFGWITGVVSGPKCRYVFG